MAYMDTRETIEIDFSAPMVKGVESGMKKAEQNMLLGDFLFALGISNTADYLMIVNGTMAQSDLMLQDHDTVQIFLLLSGG